MFNVLRAGCGTTRPDLWAPSICFYLLTCMLGKGKLVFAHGRISQFYAGAPHAACIPGWQACTMCPQCQHVSARMYFCILPPTPLIPQDREYYPTPHPPIPQYPHPTPPIPLYYTPISPSPPYPNPPPPYTPGPGPQGPHIFWGIGWGGVQVHISQG